MLLRTALKDKKKGNRLAGADMKSLLSISQHSYTHLQHTEGVVRQKEVID